MSPSKCDPFYYGLHTAYMNYMELMSAVPRKAVKFNHSLTPCVNISRNLQQLITWLMYTMTVNIEWQNKENQFIKI